MSRSLATVPFELLSDKSLKAWSVIITFFGDSVAPRGDAISTTSVQTVMAALGIGAGTVRTAFSRLAKDGWVERQKVGRNSYYMLSKTGKAPFSEAETLIYSGPLKSPHSNTQQWHLVTRSQTSNGDSNLFQHGVKLNKDSFLFARSSALQLKDFTAAEALVSTVDSTGVPEWVFDQIAPPAIADAYKNLQKNAIQISNKIPDDPLNALATRTLLIHEWRRLLLRREESNVDLLPANWPYEDCRKSVARLYHQLSPAAENWLNTEAQGPDGALKKAGVDTLNRFG